MTKRQLLSFSAICALATGTVAGPAFGQDESDNPASTADNTGLERIIVTAQRRAEDAQSVPAAITAIGGPQLQRRGIVQTSDLMGALPNLQVTSAYDTTQPNFSLRGIGVANEFSAATASPIGLYVDEVYQSFRASHGQQLFDMERVEVLRGPQGTLYGRNTTGGAINFITRRPSLEGSEGYLTVGYGSYDTYRLAGAAEATLADDQLGVRISGIRSEGDGWMDNPTLGRDFATTDTIAGRIAVRAQPTPWADLNLRVYAAENDPRSNIAFGIGYLQGETNSAGYSRTGLPDDVVESDTAGPYNTSSWGLGFTAQFELGERFTLTSITGYDRGEYRLNPFDCDGSPVDICAIRYYSESDNFNQDLRLNYAGDRFNGIVGVYFGRDEVRTENEPDFFGFLRPLLLGAGLPGDFSNVPLAVGNSLGTLPAFLLDPTLTPDSPGFCDPVVLNANGLFDARSLVAFQTDVALTNSAGGTATQAACAAAGAPPFAPILARQLFDITRPSTAIYGEADIALTDRLGLTVGLRSTWDDVEYSNASSTIFGLDGVTPVATAVPYTFPFDPNFQPLNQEESTSRISGRMVVDYQFADDVLGYASYSRGYRSGTFNALAYQDVSQVYFVEPEEVDAYEVGLKSRFWDERVQLNLAGFYYDYQNQQIAQIIGATSFLRNASGELWGGEAELNARLTPDLDIDASIGYQNTEYSGNTIDPTDPRSLTLNIDGNRFPNAPEIMGMAGFDWTVLDSDIGRVSVRGEARYMGEYFFDPFGDYGQNPCDQPLAGSNVLLATPELACGNPGYWLLNGRINYDINDTMRVSIWGNNLTDEFYYVYGLNLNAFYQDYFTRGAPRTWGMELTVNF